MPRVIECSDQRMASLGDCAAALASSGFDPRDEASLADAAGWLRRLGNDRTFLGDLLLERLKPAWRADTDGAAASYSPQAMILSDPACGTFLRANVWPSPADHLFQASGGHSFVYGMAHDHNFDFLTLGYFGPGYASDYYEYDQAAVSGEIGEPAGLRFVGRATLDPGMLLLYRAHRDVHRQLPPSSLSVSLNLMASDPAQAWRDQYGFDLERGTISAVLSPTSTEVFLRLAVSLEDEDACDLAEDWGRTHPVERIRLAAFEARVAIARHSAGKDALWREAERSGSRLVAAVARAQRAMLA